jgi:fibronectin-binding autotransporter adhesin
MTVKFRVPPELVQAGVSLRLAPIALVVLGLFPLLVSSQTINNGTLVNAGGTVLNNTDTLINNGVLLNEIGAELNNSGTIDNFGTFSNRISGLVVNTGNIYNESGATLTNDLSSTINNSNFISNLAGGTFTNSGLVSGTGGIVNSGTLDNFGQISNALFGLGGTINNEGGSIQMGTGSDILGGTLNNAAGTVGISGAGNSVTLDGRSAFGPLTIQGTFTADVGTTAYLLGTINNQGNIQVTGGQSTGLSHDIQIGLQADTTLEGHGTVTLLPNGTSAPSIVGATRGLTLTNVDNTIQGAGSFSLTNLVNQATGTVNANLSGQFLNMGTSITNAGLMEATAGGTLTTPGCADPCINFATILNSGGTISANNGTVVLSSGLVNGGTINAVNGGNVAMVAFTSQGATITAGPGSTVSLDVSTIAGGALVNSGGTLSMKDNSIVYLDGSTAFGAVTIQGTYSGQGITNVLGAINNQGNMLIIGGGAHATYGLELLADATLQGGGTVTLADVGAGAPLLAAKNEQTLTNVDNTIQGTGISFVNLVNQAGGTVDANVSGHSLLLSNLTTNAGLLEATSGGTLLTHGCAEECHFSVIANTGGTILADGGTVILEFANITGGTIKAVNGGVVNLESSATIFGGTLENAGGTLGALDRSAVFVVLDGRADAVTIKGTYTGAGGSDTNILGTFNNQGNILLDASGGLNTHLTLRSDVVLEGGGTLTLANEGAGSASFIDSLFTGLTLTNLDNTIHGAGVIFGAGAFQLVNGAAGTIRADVPGQILEINGAPLTSAGTVQADSGSTLLVLAPFTQIGGKTQVDGNLTAIEGLNVSAGSVLGTGAISGDVTMTGGTLHPGDIATPGTLTIFGNVLLTNAIFEELIGGSGNGLLLVNGVDTIGDHTNLNIIFADGFTPFSGESFTIMDFSSGSGFFANAPTTGFEMDGFDWLIAYNSGSIVLEAVSPVSGEGGGNEGGNGGGTSVPEPATASLLLGALSILAGISFRRQRTSRSAI